MSAFKLTSSANALKFYPLRANPQRFTLSLLANMQKDSGVREVLDWLDNVAVSHWEIGYQTDKAGLPLVAQSADFLRHSVSGISAEGATLLFEAIDIRATAEAWLKDNKPSSEALKRSDSMWKNWEGWIGTDVRDFVAEDLGLMGKVFDADWARASVQYQVDQCDCDDEESLDRAVAVFWNSVRKGIMAEIEKL